MKHIHWVLLLLAMPQALLAQEEKENIAEQPLINKIFAGGGINIGFGTGFMNLGGLPEIGISPFEWMDAGITANINYTTVREDRLFGAGLSSDRYRTTSVGVGPFLRLYPLKQIFVSIQPEWISVKIRQSSTSSSFTQTDKYKAFAALAGVGYAQRVVGQSNFYIMLAADIGSDLNSPYRRTGQDFIPVVRTGFNIYLGKKSTL